MDPAPLSPIWNLEHYLRRIQRKLQARTASRGAGATFAGALLLTLVCVYIANEFAFSDSSIIGGRLLLFGAVIAVIILALVRPLRRLNRKRAVEHVERSVPAFDGRVETFVSEAETQRANGGQPNPFLDLLAEDTLQVAEAAPVADVISWKRIAGYAVAALVAFFTLIWLGTSGPGYWGYGTSRLWAGWLQPNDSPLYQINVSPGDATIRQGSDLVISAEIFGFQAPSAFLYAKYADSLDWEQAPMRRQLEGSGYQFLFAAVREPLRYYVSAGGVRSDEFEVDVVSMPVVKNLKLTYHYPSWTGMKDVIEDPGGDITAVKGTEIEIEIETDKPLADGLIQVDDGREAEMAPSIAGGELKSVGRFEVLQDGRYHIAAVYKGEAVRISEDYFITLVPDRKPNLKAVHPGRDYKATSIEEVVVELQAEDDFAVSSLDLYYSVNGSEMQRARLGKRGGAKQVRSSHTFYLEELGDPASIELAVEEEDKTPETGSEEFPVANLVPGDVIAYYGVARDHKLSAQTDMFFIETRAFDRSFSQVQAAGGGMGGGQQPRNEISKRQKEIVAATWNLVKKSQQAKPSERQEIRENAMVLSDVQLTLRDQARTLVERVRARELAGTNAQFTAFVENLERAAEFMEPAAEKLGDVKLRDALSPEQKALQFLLRAEAIFRDIQLAFGSGQGSGGGQQAQLDLAEMFELEMDLHKNQYETGGGATRQQLDREQNELLDKLKELARRQQKLAERRRDQERATFADRWKQEMLRREALELKRRLEELQRQQQAQQSGQQRSGQQQSGQQQSGQPQSGGQQGGQQQNSQQQSRQQQRAGASGSSRPSPMQDPASLQQIIQRLDQATRDMQGNSSESQGQRGSQDAASARRAQERLEEALQQLSQQRRQQTASGLSEVAKRAERLAAEQKQIAERLREDMVKALEKQAEGEAATGIRSRLRSSLSPVEALEMAEQKKAMQEELEAIERKMQESIHSLDTSQRETIRTLREALSDLQQNEVATRLRVSAYYIRRGLAPHAAQSEEVVTRALEDLRRKTREAEKLAQAEGAGEQQGLERSLSQLESLRRRLEQAAGLDPNRPGQQGQAPGQQQGQQQQGQQPGQQPGPGQRQGPQSGQQGQQQAQSGQAGQQGQQGQQGSRPGQQPGQQPGGQQSAQSQQGQGQGQGGGASNQRGQRGQITRGGVLAGPQQTIGGASNYGNRRHPGGIGVWDDEMRREMERALRDGARSVPRLVRDLRTGGIYNEDLEEIRNFVRGLGGDRFKGNPNLLAQEYRRMLTLLEQLELQVRRQVEAEQGGQVRAEVNTPVPEQYREAVAEYFRRLSRQR